MPTAARWASVTYLRLALLGTFLPSPIESEYGQHTPRSTPMEAPKRTEMVNRLMEEANLMMGVLEKAMEGERVEESQPAMHGTHHPQGQYSLEDEHKAWGKVLRA